VKQRSANSTCLPRNAACPHGNWLILPWPEPPAFPWQEGAAAPAVVIAGY